MCTTCTELVVFIYWTLNSMKNLFSYCGLVGARISASEKDLPVYKIFKFPNLSRPHGTKLVLAFCNGGNSKSLRKPLLAFISIKSRAKP